MARADLSPSPPWAGHLDARPADVDETVPTPRDVLGLDPGDRPATPAEIHTYLVALADSSPRARLTHYADSVEGQPLSYLSVGAPDVLDLLPDRYRRLRAAGDPRAPRRDEAETGDLHSAVWVGASIHGDEPSGGDAVLAAAYRLVAGEDSDARLFRERLVVHLDPVANPDGRRRHLSQTRTFAARTPSLHADDVAAHGLWPSGRGNHYLFDLNRDLILQTQPETRGRTAAMLSTLPQVVLELHEMDSQDTFLFASPGQPHNPHWPAHVLEWWQRLGVGHGADLDTLGIAWYRGEWNEVFYPGYQDIWPAFSGAVPVIFEQAHVAASSSRRRDGSIAQYRDAVRSHTVSILANLRVAAEESDQLLKGWIATRRDSTTTTDAPTTYLVPADGRSAARLDRLAQVLSAQGIEVHRATRDTAEAPIGSLLVHTDQPCSRLVRVLMDEHVPMPDAFLEQEWSGLTSSGRTRVFDVTAWSLPLAFGLEVTTTDETPSADWRPYRATARGSGTATSARYAYLIDDPELTAAALLLGRGTAVNVAVEPFEHGGSTFPAGALVVRSAENLPLGHGPIEAAARIPGVRVVATDSPGSTAGIDLAGRLVVPLNGPRIAVLAGAGLSETSFGAVRHLLDVELSLPGRVLDLGALGVVPDDIDVIIAPELEDDGSGELHFPRARRRRLASWVRRGGTLIVLGNSVRWATSGAGLMRARLRGDQPELRQPAIEPHAWCASTRGSGWASPALDEPPSAAEDARALRLLPSGALLQVDVDVRHWLGLGAERSVVAMTRVPDALIATAPTDVVARFAPSDRLHRGGLLWPSAAERLASTAFVTCDRRDRGAVIGFASDPLWRGGGLAARQLFVRAVLFGPSHIDLAR